MTRPDPLSNDQSAALRKHIELFKALFAQARNENTDMTLAIGSCTDLTELKAMESQITSKYSAARERLLSEIAASEKSLPYFSLNQPGA
jgi:hypothetical protein